MQDSCKATITLGDSKITFEGPSEFVQAQVEKFAAMQPAGTLLGDNADGTERPARRLTEKQLVIEKRPRGHHEIATVLAFALTESGMKEFSEEEIRRAYIRADVRPPKYVSQALRDAKSKYDYITTGSKRGMYRLTNHGDRTVRFDLPRSTR
ncbi:MAG: hypothetical protein ABSD72_18150 [Terracidiphilus sp.]